MLTVMLPALTVLATQAKALSMGGRMVYSPSRAWDATAQQSLHAEWDISGRCSSPVHLRQEGRGHLVVLEGMENIAGRKRYEPPRALDLVLRCRQCPECLWARRVQWGHRAVVEYQQNPRTWFGTLTINPGNRSKLIQETDLRLRDGGERLSGLKPLHAFTELHRTTGGYVTKFIKRLRRGTSEAKYPPGLFKYMYTVEPHQDWFPHYHILISELIESKPVTYDMLERPWELGFVKWNLVHNNKRAWYAGKYLGKFSMARVRASEQYGLPYSSLSIDETHRVSPF